MAKDTVRTIEKILAAQPGDMTHWSVAMIRRLPPEAKLFPLALGPAAAFQPIVAAGSAAAALVGVAPQGGGSETEVANRSSASASLSSSSANCAKRARSVWTSCDCANRLARAMSLFCCASLFSSVDCCAIVAPTPQTSLGSCMISG